MPVRLLNEDDIRSADLPLQRLLELTREVYRRDAQGSVQVPLKIGVRPSRPHSFLDAMPAWVGGDNPALGMKWVSYFPGNQSLGREDSTGIIILNDPAHGHPVSIMEGMHITFLRTAACAAVMAADVIGHAPQSLALVGCGGLARSTIRVMKVAFPSIRTVYVSSRTEASRRQFCQEMQSEGDMELIPVAHPADAVRQADIVVSSIPPTDAPPIDRAHFKPGAVYIPLDLLNAWQDNVLTPDTVVVADSPAFLHQLVRTHRPGLEGQVKNAVAYQDITLDSAWSLEDPQALKFIAVCGIASTDVLIGWEIYRRACERGLGTLYELLPRHSAGAAANGVQAEQFVQER